MRVVRLDRKPDYEAVGKPWLARTAFDPYPRPRRTHPSSLRPALRRRPSWRLASTARATREAGSRLPGADPGGGVDERVEIDAGFDAGAVQQCQTTSSVATFPGARP